MMWRLKDYIRSPKTIFKDLFLIGILLLALGYLTRLQFFWSWGMRFAITGLVAYILLKRQVQEAIRSIIDKKEEESS